MSGELIVYEAQVRGLVLQIGAPGACKKCGGPVFWLSKHPARGGAFVAVTREGRPHTCDSAKPATPSVEDLIG